jgi:hypothetical protein
VSRLKEDQEEWLLALEQAARILGKQVEDRKENVKSTENWEILTYLNPVLKEQLGQLQYDNMSLTSALGAKQNVKKKLAMKLGQLQESLNDLKAFMEVNSQEAPNLQNSETSAYSTSRRTWWLVKSMWLPTRSQPVRQRHQKTTSLCRPCPWT